MVFAASGQPTTRCGFHGTLQARSMENVLAPTKPFEHVHVPKLRCTGMSCACSSRPRVAFSVALEDIRLRLRSLMHEADTPNPDPAMTAAMREAGIKVDEKRVLEDLLHDLRRSGWRSR